MTKSKKYEAILFDLDGTLINTIEIIFKCFDQAFKTHFPDLVLTKKQKADLLGPTLFCTFSKYTDDQKTIEAAIKTYKACSKKAHDTTQINAYPKAIETLKELKKRHLKIGVITSKASDAASYGLKLAGLLEFVDLIIGAYEVTKEKPDPEGINLALEKLQVKSEFALYVGDHENDIKAAHGAKVTSVGVAYSLRLDEINHEKPDYMISRLDEILKLV